MQQNLRTYKGVVVGRGSALAEAMLDKDKKVAEKVFKATTDRYNALYPEADRQWFADFGKPVIQPPSVESIQ